MNMIPGVRCAFAILALALLPGLSGLAQAQPRLPAPTGRVSDFANVLDERVEAELTRILQETEDKTTAEIAVVTVPTLQGLSIDEYANRLFNQWGIGRAQVDNGVLVLMAPGHREMKIEVGYGLEGVIPDGLAGEISRTHFHPHFRNNDFGAGIEEGVRRIAAVVQRNHVLTPAELAALAQPAQDRPPIWLMVPFLGAFVGIGFYMLGMGAGAKVGFPMIFGGLFGGLPMIFSLIPFFNAPIWIMGPMALAVFSWGFRNGRKGGGMVEAFRMMPMRVPAGQVTWVGTTGDAKSGSSSSGWSSSSSSSSWSSGSSSSSSSGSSSSFGGGSSGGGGASSKW